MSILFSFGAWNVGDYEALDRALATHMAIFHEHKHDTHHRQIRTPLPARNGTVVSYYIFNLITA